MVTKYPIQVFYLTREQFKKLVEFFHDNWADNYKNERDARNDLYSYLDFNYDKYYAPTVTALVNQILNEPR